jgi:excinuclease UvrABC nuclease subunit
MDLVNSIADLPTVPGIYAMLSGAGRRTYVAYVGVGENLRRR